MSQPLTGRVDLLLRGTKLCDLMSDEVGGRYPPPFIPSSCHRGTWVNGASTCNTPTFDDICLRPCTIRKYANTQIHKNTHTQIHNGSMVPAHVKVCSRVDCVTIQCNGGAIRCNMLVQYRWRWWCVQYMEVVRKYNYGAFLEARKGGLSEEGDFL